MWKTAILALVGLLSLSTAVQAETWNLPTAYPITSFHTRNLELFAQDVEKTTEGRIKIRVHSAGSLFKHPEIKQSIRSGQVQLGEFLLSQLSNENPIFQIDSLPFIATTYEDSARLWAITRPYVEEQLDEEGLTVLFSVPWPPQILYTKKPVNEVRDLQNSKLRTYNVIQAKIARSVSATPVHVEVVDIPQAFSTNRINAMITSSSTGATAKAWEFVSHVYQTNAWLPKNVVVINTKLFESLDPQDRKLLLAAAAQAEKRGVEMSKEEDTLSLDLLKTNGISIEKPSAKLESELRDIGLAIADEWTEAAGADGRAILRKFNKK